jgi:hydrogenase maturation protease
MTTNTPMATATATNMLTNALLPEARPRILVAGLGNSILQDDGIGVHAALALQPEAPEGVLAVEVGTAVLDALHLFEWADYILAIDAMQAGGQPGDLYLLDERGVSGGPIQTSLHELSLKASLRFAQSPVTQDVIVIGVEPAEMGFGLDLTPQLQSALPSVVSLAGSIIRQWRDDDTGSHALQALAEMAGATPLTPA